MHVVGRDIDVLSAREKALLDRLEAIAAAREPGEVAATVPKPPEARSGGADGTVKSDEEATTRDELRRVSEALRTAQRRTYLVGAGAALTAVVLTLFVPVLVRDPGARLIAGIVLVVVIGGLGLVLRGLGELRGSSRSKAIGYFLGAGAYVATATVALTNGLPLLLN